MHGLLAGKDHWKGFIRELHSAVNRSEKNKIFDLFLLNARHHGSYPKQSHLCHPSIEESTGHLLVDMVGDTINTLDMISLFYNHSPIIIGHSMGAKVGMMTALCSPHLSKTQIQQFRLGNTPKIKSIISLDASPANYTHSHSNLLSSMSKLDLSKVQSIHHGSNLLDMSINDKTTSAFACTNLIKLSDIYIDPDTAAHTNINPQSVYTWRLNLPVLQEQESHVHSWPLVETLDLLSLSSNQSPNSIQEKTGIVKTIQDPMYPGKVLFIGATQSSRLTTPDYTKNIPKYFPNSTIEILRGGHFVHYGPDIKKCADLCVQHMNITTD